MKERYEVRLAAVGGQGLITAGALLAKTAINKKNLYATQSPTYTSQVRGGPTKVDVIIDSKPIIYPQAVSIDLYFATAQKSFDLYYRNIKEDAVIVVDSDLVTKLPENDNHKIYKIPLTEATSKEIGNMVVVSVVSLAVVSKLSGLFTKDELKEVILSSVPKGTEEINMKALDLGFKLV